MAHRPGNLAAVKRIAPILVLAMVAAACSGTAEPSPTTAGPAITTSTSTTIDVQVCEDLADDAVAWVSRLIDELEGIRFEVLVDRALWPDGLVQVDEAGTALQAASDAAGCDESLIRGAVVAAAAGMESDSATARMLLDLLVPASETETPAETTSTTDPAPPVETTSTTEAAPSG